LAAANGKNLLVLGGSVVGQCLDAGLLGEILIHLAPILLRDGVQFFDTPTMREIRLETVSVARSGSLTDLRFRVSHAQR
jgi:dihydrofolate reductase